MIYILTTQVLNGTVTMSIDTCGIQANSFEDAQVGVLNTVKSNLIKNLTKTAEEIFFVLLKKRTIHLQYFVEWKINH